MLLPEYRNIVSKISDDKKLSEIGIDENLKIGFLDQTGPIIDMLLDIGAYKDSHGLRSYIFGESKINLDIRDSGSISATDQVKNSDRYNSILNFFHGYGEGFTVISGGHQDMKTVVLRTLDWAIEKQMPGVVCYSTRNTGEVAIHHFQYQLQS